MKLGSSFCEIYGQEPEAEFFAPGRVNLIGEHIDYNAGLVFPCALTFGTYGAVRLREDRTVRLASLNFPEKITFSLDENVFDPGHGWGNYPKGVIKEFQELGHRLGGMDLLVSGDIPQGSGLSSSASLEVLVATMINQLFGLGLDKVSIAKLCQRAENRFVGVNCGIMDQFAVALGKRDHAILLNCDSLDYEYAPLKLEGVSIIIGNTKKPRGLADSKYNERRSECESALKDLQKAGVLSPEGQPLSGLCQLSPEEFEQACRYITNETALRRARHAVYENQRVKDAVKVLREGDLAAFGALMNASHDSLRDLYEVTGLELDAMVDAARSVKGVLGSRMTGAGFGGCTVSLVQNDQIDAFIQQVGTAYQKKTGLKPEFYIAGAGDGALREDEPITLLVEMLLAYGIRTGLIQTLDTVYFRNQLLSALKLKAPYPPLKGLLPPSEAFDKIEPLFEEGAPLSPQPILDKILDYMAKSGLMEEDTIAHRDLLDAKLMGLLTDRPSHVQEAFWLHYQEGPEKASEYFYHLSRANHYIMEERVRRNLSWTSASEYGDLQLTINLSKPEKDPRVIARLLGAEKTSYPQCLLCPENVGFEGNLGHAARQNLRQIKMSIQGEDWYLQYSPYTYYQEHCILLKESHVPMNVDEVTFRRLFDFVEAMPHYFMGSNAGLPVVGGSILTHEHYQGGHHTFPMERASVRQSYRLLQEKDVEVRIMHWPLSCIRLNSRDKEALLRVADRILKSWQGYSDLSCEIAAYTGEVPHNAVTPIARMKDGVYELDIVLRNNRTSEEFPDGIFHPHPELHHIKKENIGLIEVMGLAILPGRLQKEFSLLAQILSGKLSLEGLNQADQEAISKHLPWLEELQERYPRVLLPQEAEEVLKKEAGSKFCRVLEDAGVFKNTPKGLAAFEKFMLLSGFSRL